MESDDGWETVSSNSLDSTEDVTPSLPPIPRHVSRSDNELCPTCKSLELDVKRFIVLPGDKEFRNPNYRDESIISFGYIEEIRTKRHYCPLCRLVLRAVGGDLIPAIEDGEPIYIELSWSTDGPAPDPKDPYTRMPAVRLLRPQVRKLNSFDLNVRKNFFPEITLLANDSPIPSTTPFFVRPFDEDKVDFAIVHRWLALCKEYHGYNCQENPIIKELKRTHPADEVPDFRCIDVERNCLVKPEGGCRYTVLSYVWGLREFLSTSTANVQDLEKPGSLVQTTYGDRIPPTIKDAMEISRQLGVRYLWVDSLCIVQDDTSGNKIEAIKKMDLVYAAAYVVIIAASSADAYAGIPGVRPGSRGMQQPIEEIAPNFRLAFKTRFQDFIEDARHFTRGWTYQELHFATKSLTFIGGQVVYRCQASSQWQEHLFENAVVERKSRLAYDPDDINESIGLIMMYSMRELTYKEDIYNAFAGVSRQLCFQLGTSICHGIPTIFFDWFLRWETTHCRDLYRRPNAPSWSWCGWYNIGGISTNIAESYDRSIRRIRKAMKKRTWIIWYHRHKHDSMSCSLLSDNSESEENVHAGKTNFYGGPVQRRFGSLDCSTTRPTNRTLSPTTPLYSLDILTDTPMSGYLQFWTVSLIFRLDEPAPSSPAIDEPIAPNTRQLLGIFGSSGRQLGTVSVQKVWSDKNPRPCEVEFILICEVRDGRAMDVRDVDVEKGWKYLFMAIEWKGKDGEYAERVALGTIGKKDWTEGLGCGPLWKEIVLG